MSADAIHDVIVRWMEHRDQIATRWRLRGSGFAVMNADGTRNENMELTEFAKLHNRFTDELRQAIRRELAPPVYVPEVERRCRDACVNALELEAVNELLANMSWRGGWDGDIR